jgi:hypothetical protein
VFRANCNGSRPPGSQAASARSKPASQRSATPQARRRSGRRV